MPSILTADYDDRTRRHHFIVVKVALTGAYTTGGDVLDLSNILNPAFKWGVIPGKVPDEIDVLDVPAGYDARVLPNPNAPVVPLLANAFVLVIYSTAVTELPAAAYPAALTASTLRIRLKGEAWSF